MIITVTVLTQSADYLMLEMEDDLTNAIQTPDGVSVSMMETVTPGCLVASAFTWYGCSMLPTLSHDLYHGPSVHIVHNQRSNIHGDDSRRMF